MSAVTLETLRIELQSFATVLLRSELRQLKDDIFADLLAIQHQQLKKIDPFEDIASSNDQRTKSFGVPRFIESPPVDSKGSGCCAYEPATLNDFFDDDDDDDRPRHDQSNWARDFAGNSKFKATIIGSIIVSLAAFVVQVDYNAIHWTADPLFQIHVLESVFLLIFICEITLRICGERLQFFSGPHRLTNIFDLALVLLQGTEFILINLSLGRTFVGALRILRASRLLRVWRLMHLVPAMRMIFSHHSSMCGFSFLNSSHPPAHPPPTHLISISSQPSKPTIQNHQMWWALRRDNVSIVSSLGSLCWILLFVCLTAGTFAVVITQIVTEHKIALGREAIEQHQQILEEYFGSVSMSNFRLYQTISDGEHWDKLAEPLMNFISPWIGCILVAYTALVTFALMNVVTAFFVETALVEAQEDRQKHMSNILWRLFHVNVDQNRAITEEDFMANLYHPSMKEYLKSLDLTPEKARDMRFFRLVDKALVLWGKRLDCCRRAKTWLVGWWTKMEMAL